MTLNVHSIASDGLVYCADKIEERMDGEERKTYVSSINNVLKAQKFDAIPLRKKSGRVEKIARRRLHDGDLEEPVFILDLDECATVEGEISILESIFLVLSNEHHILFILEKGTPIKILTMSMLNQRIVLEYLRILFAQLESQDWGWNQEFLSREELPGLDYPDRIFSKITELARLVDDEERLPSDKDLSVKIVEILSLLQPVKFATKSLDIPDIELVRYEYHPVKKSAGDFMSWPAASMIAKPGFDTEAKMIFEIFAHENNWDSLVMRGEKNEFLSLCNLDEEGNFEFSRARTVSKNLDMLATLQNLEKNESYPLVVPNDEDVYWPGIITAEDILLAESFLIDLISRIAKIEKFCQAIALSDGIVYVSENLVVESDWSKLLISLQDSIIFKRMGLSRSSLNELRKWRNLLVHSYLPIAGDDDMPKWMKTSFSSKILSLRDIETIIEKQDVDYSLSHALKGLNEYLRGKVPKKVTRIYKEESGLESARLDRGVLFLSFKKDSKLIPFLEKIPNHELTLWCNCKGIEINLVEKS